MQYKGFIIDLEGTIIQNGAELNGSFEFLNKLTKQNIPFRVITNTVSKTVEELSANIKNIGYDIPPSYILNPIKAVNYFLEEQDTASYFFVGSSKISSQITIKSSFKNTPEYLILCDFEYITCDYNLLNQIYTYLLNGAKLLSTSYSNFYLTKDGAKIDTGAFTKMFEILSNQKATIFGKPSLALYQAAINQMKITKDCVLAIGDDVLTDVKGAKDFGIATALVQTGKYKSGDINIFEPDLLLKSLSEATKLI